MVTSRMALDRGQLGRYVAALFGLVALVCFYQPWVSGSLPQVGESRFTGWDLARGEPAARTDAALFGIGAKSLQAGTTPAAGSASTGGLTLPTRVPTAVAGSAPASGGLTLPTRVPTVVPGAAGASAPASAPGAANTTGAAAQGGLTLPTRVPTVAPGSTVPAGGSLLSSGASVEIGRQITREEPDSLPQASLYTVPLAAAGITIFSLIWDRLDDPRDRRYGKWWIVLLSFGGVAGVGYVLYKIATAPAANDLLAPGAARAAQWGLWGTFLAFALSATGVALAWLAAPQRPAAS